MKVLGEIIRELVTDVAETYGKNIFYDYGHPLSIISRLAIKTNIGRHSDKYPMIAMFLDAPESEDLMKLERKATITLVIIAESKEQFTEQERTTEVFDPVLIPIYEALKKHLLKGGIIRATKLDPTFRYSWGKTGIYQNTANIFNDFVDAIEINNLEIEILKTC